MDEEKIQKSDKSQTGLDKTLQVLGIVFGIIVTIIGFIVTIIQWSFIAAMFILGTIFWIIDAFYGDGRNRVRPPWDKPRQRVQFDPNQFRRELQKATVKDILKEFGEQVEEIDKKNQLQSEEKKVIRKLRGLDRSALRSQLQDALTDDELEILFILLLKILSGELG